jgi:hypothetical protein
MLRLEASLYHCTSTELYTVRESEASFQCGMWILQSNSEQTCHPLQKPTVHLKLLSIEMDLAERDSIERPSLNGETRKFLEKYARPSSRESL